MIPLQQGEFTERMPKKQWLEKVREAEAEAKQPLAEPFQDFNEARDAYFGKVEKAETNPLLDAILNREQLVAAAATKKVVFSPPLISRAGVGIFGRGTINIIQGAYGSHKSRVAELYISFLLSQNPHNPQFLGFERNALERFCAAYIDSERNLAEELPHAIQNIKLRAGYTIEERPDEFRFASIKEIDRKDRFKAIEVFLAHVRQNTSLHIFVVIDVVTDAIGDFNDPKESMKLFDFVGNLCDRHNATFLLVIHQNPGTEKARGHTGTEAANKASTVLQIGFEKDASQKDTDLIRLRFLKLRRGKRPDDLFLQYSDKTHGLVLADAAAIAANVNARKHKADSSEIAERMGTLLADGPMEKGEVYTVLEAEFKAKNATIRERIKSIFDTDIFDEQGGVFRLCGYKVGRKEYFKLAPAE